MSTQGLRRLLPLFLFFLPALAFGATRETVAVEALGMGGSRDEAVAAALAQAVIQVQGGQLPPDELAKMFLQSMREERMMRMSVLVDARIRATRLSTAVAFVPDYQVVAATRQKKNGQWQARVNAEVVSPEARLAKRQESIRLAVLPLRFMQEEEAELADAAGQLAMKQTLDNIATFQGLVSRHLDKQGRIAIRELSPQHARDFEGAADNPGQTDWKQVAAATGADNFVTAQVEEFRMAAIEIKRGVLTSRLDGRFVINYRVIRLNDGQPEIVKTGVFKLDTHAPALQKLTAATGERQITRQQADARVKTVHEQAARLFAHTLLAELVPPDVLAREGENVLLQNGASPLRRGERLAVHGPDFVEPDASTGLMLRQDGMRIAILEVSDVADRRIVARVVKGNAFGVQAGCLVRRLGVGSAAAASTPPQAAK